MSRLIRGAMSPIDAIVGAVGGVLGTWWIRSLYFPHTYTSHLFTLLEVDYIFALITVILLCLLPFGPRVPAHTQLGRGPLPNVGFGEEIRSKTF